jgi:AcrR family transcriptional regulator
LTKASNPAYRRLAEDERRGLLIDATIDVLSEFGLSGTTVRRIATQAGVTPGLVTHHFAGKDGLVSAAYRRLADKFHDDYVAAGQSAGSDPIARLKAFVGCAFQPETLDRNLLRVWTSFWTSALADPTSEPARVHYETAQRSRTYLATLLRDALESVRQQPSEEQIHELAIAVWSLVDGMWLTWGLDPELFDPEDGRRITFDVLAARLAIPEIVSDPSRHQSAETG